MRKRGEVIKPRQLGMGNAVQFVAQFLNQNQREVSIPPSERRGERKRERWGRGGGQRQREFGSIPPSEREREMGGGGGLQKHSLLDTTLGEREREREREREMGCGGGGRGGHRHTERWGGERWGGGGSLLDTNLGEGGGGGQRRTEFARYQYISIDWLLRVFE